MLRTWIGRLLCARGRHNLEPLKDADVVNVGYCTRCLTLHKLAYTFAYSKPLSDDPQRVYWSRVEPPARWPG